jgi:hypothetical protein
MGDFEPASGNWRWNLTLRMKRRGITKKASNGQGEVKNNLESFESIFME